MMSELQNLYLSASGMDEFQFRSGAFETAPMPGDQAPWRGGEPPFIPWKGGEPPSIVDTSVGEVPHPGTVIVPPGAEIPPGPAATELTESWDAATTVAMSDQSGAAMVGDGLWFDLG